MLQYNFDILSKAFSHHLTSEMAMDPECWSRLWKDSAFFFRTGSGHGVKILWKTGAGVTFQFLQ